MDSYRADTGEIGAPEFGGVGANTWSTIHARSKNAIRFVIEKIKITTLIQSSSGLGHPKLYLHCGSECELGILSLAYFLLSYKSGLATQKQLQSGQQL